MRHHAIEADDFNRKQKIKKSFHHHLPSTVGDILYRIAPLLLHHLSFFVSQISISFRRWTDAPRQASACRKTLTPISVFDRFCDGVFDGEWKSEYLRGADTDIRQTEIESNVDEKIPPLPPTWVIAKREEEKKTSTDRGTWTREKMRL